MGFLSDVLEVLLDWVRAIWPGVGGAAAVGYLGWSILGLPGFLVGAAAGALGGTWAGNKLGLVTVKRMTSSRQRDQLLYAGAAFLLIVLGYFLFQIAIVIATIVAIATIAGFWLAN